MRRILAVSFVLVLALGLAPNATADHASKACNSAALIATSTIGANCALVLACPATGLTCIWDLTVEVRAVGEVQGRVLNVATGLSLVTCGPELLECSTTAPFTLSPTGVVNLECWVFGSEHFPAVLAGLTCTAVAAGHVAG